MRIIQLNSEQSSRRHKVLDKITVKPSKVGTSVKCARDEFFFCSSKIPRLENKNDKVGKFEHIAALIRRGKSQDQ